MWLPRFACPECCREIGDGATGLRCGVCGIAFGQEGHLFRFLTPARAERARPFERQYLIVRARDGHRTGLHGSLAAASALPGDHPLALEWRIRRESVRHLERAARVTRTRRLRVLDLGAGSGWLSSRYASKGHHAVAVDRLDDALDGLGASLQSPTAFAAVQADFLALPFVPRQFDLVVFNGSLHYAPDPAAALAEARRMLAPSGALAVMDSPVFERDADGESMVEAQLARIAQDHGLASTVRPGVGFLTFAGVARAFATVGLQGRFRPTRGPLGWRVRRQLARLRLGRHPAAFGVWVAR